MSNIQRYSVIETALCIGSKVLDGEVEMVRASEHDAELAALREELAKIKSYSEGNEMSKLQLISQISKAQDEINQWPQSWKDSVNQSAFEHGQPEENGDGYLFTQEEFDAFIENISIDGQQAASVLSNLFIDLKNHVDSVGYATMQQCLTAAEQRNAELVELLKRAKPYIPWNRFGTVQYQWNIEARAAINPIESGASE